MRRLTLIAVILLSATQAQAQHTPVEVHEAVRASGGIELFVKKLSGDFSSSLPVMTNQNVEIISVAAHGRSLAFLTRLVNVDKADVHDLDALKSSNVNYYACNSPVLGVLIEEYDVEIFYSATAKGTEYLFQYKVDKHNCEGK